MIIEGEKLTINKGDKYNGYKFIDCDITFTFQIRTKHPLSECAAGDYVNRYFTKEFIDVFTDEEKDSCVVSFERCNLC